MNSTDRIRRFSFPVSIFLGGTVAAANAAELVSYDVPPSLLVACTASIWAIGTTCCQRLADAWTTTTHRCREEGCDFTVRLSGSDAAENRRWQEIAAQHPHRH
ncbi:hypothetical protein AB0I82_23180 [Streptomyces sp. NPDC050315]|uniref:hypothetical protein n=1 Tax=Streptomyces sp. NPDC050315 TaxID=3155039 RepID=UPI003439D60E